MADRLPVGPTPVDDDTIQTRVMKKSASYNSDHVAPFVCVPGIKRRASSNSAMFVKTTQAGDRPWLIMGIIYVKEELDPNSAWFLIKKRLLSFERFRSKVVVQGSGVYFEELEMGEIDRDYHLMVENAEGWTSSDMCRFLSQLYMVEKDRDRPLWSVHILNRLADGRHALVINVDHSLGDGICMVEALLSTFDGVVECPGSTSGVQTALKEVAVKRATHKHSLGYLERALTVMYGIAQPITAIVGFSDPASRLKPVSGPDAAGPMLPTGKTIATADALCLERVKDVKNKFKGATVNDVLSAVLALTLKRYFTEAGDAVLDSRSGVSACFSVSLRKRGESVKNSFGNRVCNDFIRFVFKDMDSRTKAVWTVKRQIDRVKNSPATVICDAFLKSIACFLPDSSLSFLLKHCISKYTILMSNVPGPQGICYFGGNEVDELTFYTFLPVGCYCGLVSYNGRVSCSFASDPWLPDPKNLAMLWADEFQKLHEEVMSHEGMIDEPLGGGGGGMWGWDGALLVGAAVAGALVIYLRTRRQ